MICAGLRRDIDDPFFKALPFVKGPNVWNLPRSSAPVRHGKVRDVISVDGGAILFASDRVSAFDKILATVPHKGEILNLISLFWFEKLAEVIPNHIIRPLGSRAVLVREAQVVPIEVVVRGFLTGSAWRDYTKNQPISGVVLPSGMVAHQKLPQPIITPSTKAEFGAHDEPVSQEEILSRGIVTKQLWTQIADTALQLFTLGQEIAAQRGLYLVDTKYEFGLIDGQLVLIDEVHTPDSSRYWYVDGYEQALSEGSDPQALDKEFLRRWLLSQGFDGSTSPPEIPADVIDGLSFRYQTAFSAITGETFSPMGDDPQAEREAIESLL